MKNKIDWKILRAELAGEIKIIYPYFLGFYLISLVLALIFKTWRSFFYWPGLNVSIIMVTILFIFSLDFPRINWRQPMQSLVHFFVANWRRPISALARVLIFSWRQLVWTLVRVFVLLFKELLLALTVVRQESSQITKRDWLKIIAISLIVIFSLTRTINVLELAVLVYGLLAFFFVLDSRLAAGLALVSLAMCPVLLFFKRDIWAESTAVYAFYFLVITVLTQIRELRHDEGTK